MKNNFLVGLTAGLVTATALIAGGEATAQVTQEQYDKQYENAAEGSLFLDYETWQTFNDVVNKERKKLTELEMPRFDLNRLNWENGVQDVEVYFINEGAGYRNQLFFSTDSGESKEVIFDDVSSPLSILKNNNGPLSLGQGVSLGDFAGETFLEFFLKSNGKNGGSKFLGFDAAKNPDGLEHIIGFEFGEYLLLGFEDIVGGGDLDYNDTVFVVKGVTGESESVPEPAAVLGLLGVGATLVLRRR